MTDQELLQAIGQVIETKVEPVRQDIRELYNKVDRLETKVDSLDARVTSLEGKLSGVRVYIDTDLRRTLNLLLEGQQALWDRFVPQEQYNTLESRTEVLELAVKRHSQEVRELKRA